MIERLAAIWQVIARWPRLFALVLGLLGATAFPPLGLWPVGLLSLALLTILLKDAARPRDAAVLGWLFGWSHLSLANNWIATAFTYQADMPVALGAVAVPLLCVYLAIYPAIAAWAARALLEKRPAFGSILAFGAVFGAFWIVTEWLRSWVFTGYPWPPLGLMLLGNWDSPGIARVLPWVGTYALSGMTIVLAAGLAALAVRKKWPALALAVAATAAVMLWPAGRGAEGDVRFTLVQPLLPQDELNDPSKFEEQFARIARLTLPSRDENRLVLWPESAVPDYLEDGYPQIYYSRMTAAGDPAFARSRIGSLVGENSLLLTGLVHLDIGEKAGVRRAVSARNAVSLLDGEGQILETYSKAHLVPYGEYLPMKWLLEPLGLTRLVAGSIEYLPGPGPRTLDVGEFGSAGIQVCYEIVFSGQVVDPAKRPDFIFNPSNDGWFGSWGSPQFVGQSRMRAIEEGLPVLRSTTTGISAVIDAEGIVRSSIGRGLADRIEGRIPPPKSPTMFSRLGNALPLAWAIVILVACFVGSSVATRRRDV